MRKIYNNTPLNTYDHEAKVKLAKQINNNQLVIQVSTLTTNKTLYANIYVLEDNQLNLLGRYKSTVVGMNRVFEIFYTFVEDVGLKLNSSREDDELTVYQRYTELW